MLIDEKTKLAIWRPSTQKSVLDTLQRVKSAVDQNPGYKVAYEFPNQKVEAQAKAFIRSMVSIALLVLGQEPHECSGYRAMVLCVSW